MPLFGFIYRQCSLCIMAWISFPTCGVLLYVADNCSFYPRVFIILPASCCSVHYMQLQLTFHQTKAFKLNLIFPVIPVTCYLFYIGRALSGICSFTVCFWFYFATMFLVHSGMNLVSNMWSIIIRCRQLFFFSSSVHHFAYKLWRIVLFVLAFSTFCILLTAVFSKCTYNWLFILSK